MQGITTDNLDSTGTADVQAMENLIRIRIIIRIIYLSPHKISFTVINNCTTNFAPQLYFRVGQKNRACPSSYI
jgi:hypothetical protein